MKDRFKNIEAILSFTEMTVLQELSVIAGQATGGIGKVAAGYYEKFTSIKISFWTVIHFRRDPYSYYCVAFNADTMCNVMV